MKKKKKKNKKEAKRGKITTPVDSELEDYLKGCVPIENFGKDMINAVLLMVGYSRKKKHGKNLHLVLNRIRELVYSCSHDTIDIAELHNPYPKWYPGTKMLQRGLKFEYKTAHFPEPDEMMEIVKLWKSHLLSRMTGSEHESIEILIEEFLQQK